MGDQTDVFWKFYSPADTLWSPKTVGWVLGYLTAIWQFTVFLLKLASPQVKGDLISNIPNSAYEMPHQLPNNLRLRILGK